MAAKGTKIGWVVRAKAKNDKGNVVTKDISKNFSSEAAAEQFAGIARKNDHYTEVWVSENHL
jgi:hypothetical protein